MPDALARAWKVGMIAGLVTSSSWLSVGTSSGLSVGGISPQITGFPFVFEPVLVTGPAVPFPKNVVLSGDTGARLAIPHFAAGGPEGWYMVYGIIVSAGQDSVDPKRWISSSFFPVQVTSPSQQLRDAVRWR